MPVRIICTDKKGDKPIVALVYDEERDLELSNTYYPDGRAFRNAEDWRDLFFAPTKHEGWVNIYCAHSMSCGLIYQSEEKAKQEIARGRQYITTNKIEWEEKK